MGRKFWIKESPLIVQVVNVSLVTYKLLFKVLKHTKVPYRFRVSIRPNLIPCEDNSE